MSYKKSKTKNIGIIAGIIAAIIVIVLAVVYINMRPYLRIGKTLRDLADKNYEYSIDYKIEGIDLKAGNELLEGNLSGKKCKDTIKGAIRVDKKKYLEIYAQKAGKCLFNVTPTLELITDQIGGSFPFGSLLSGSIPNIYISLDQIREITGDDSVQYIEDAEFFSKLPSTKELEISKTEKPSDVLEAEYSDGMFYQVDYKEQGISAIVGLPKKSDSKIYLKVSNDKMTINFYITYKLKDINEIKMPEETVSDSGIELIKNIYGLTKKNDGNND